MRHFSDLRWLHFADTANAITDEGFRYVGELKHIEDLTLPPGITDAGIERLQWSTSLTKLSLGRSQVTDEGLKRLAGLTNMQTLITFLTPQITGQGFKHLSRLTELTNLLVPARFNDESMPCLVPFQKLYILNIAACPGVTDAGLIHDSKMGGLTGLYLGEGVTDAGIRHLESMPHLTLLDLRQTKVTDACFDSLVRMTNLNSLYFPGTISHRGLERLLALPKLRGLTVTNGLNDDAIPVLMKFTHLNDLTLDSTGISKDGIDRLKEHFKSRPLLLVPPQMQPLN
ncbi:MAG: hypothetical protein O3C40_14605 [Planctomycetota bacterium]|nr:hypothetical protein [Planctomycetota bacterium]